jgi:hypothetical protein
LIRIHGARSSLRPSYAIDDQLARGVRVTSGERDGEPYVDVLVSLGDGATLAQKKSFNRLVIGIAADFAHLRRRAPSTGGTELARKEVKSPAAISGGVPVSSSSASSTSAVSNSSAGGQLEARDAAIVNSFVPATAPQEMIAASLLATMPQPSLRSRPVWNRLLGSPLNLNSRAALDLSHGSPQTLNAATLSGQPFLFKFIPMTINAPGESRGVWVPGTTTSMEDEIGGRPFGSGVLRPSFSLGAFFSDNYFYRSTTGRNLGVFSLAPRLEYEIPGEERALRLDYEAKLRKLTNGQWAIGQRFDFDMRADLTPYLRLGVRNHFVRSPLDSREFDPAGEVYIVGDTFNRDNFGARFDYSFGQRSRLGLDLGYNTVRWSKSHIASAPLFIDYDDVTAALTYERDISEQTTGFVSFGFTNTKSFAPLRPQFNGLNDNRIYAVEIGARTQVTETSGVVMRIGYERNDYRHAPDPNNFRGLIFDLLFRSDLTEKTNLQLSALRKTQVSAFNLEGGNARLVTTGGAGRLETAATEALQLALGLYYQRLGFPVAIVPSSTASGGLFVGNFVGERRSDNLYGFNLEAAYRWSELLKTRLVYNFSRRDSTIPVFTFNTNSLSLVFELGRRNEARGRPF